MKTATQNNVKSTNLTSKSFTIKTCAKAFEILSSGLYKDKITSITRELISNAYDAHIAAGVDRPVEVHLPSELDHNIYFIDHGIGMSEEQIMNMYTTYFDSDKTDTNEQIGGFGLGSKSPFSYTNSFMVASSKDGMKKKFLCFVNEEGPQITKLSEEPCDETGTTISFVVKSLGYYSDRSLFRDAVNRIKNYNWDKPNLIEMNDQTYHETHKVKNVFDGVDGIYQIGNTYYSNECLKVRIGIFWYDVDASMLNEQASLIAKRLKRLVIDLNIGDIDLVASREGISYTKRTIDFLNRKMVEVQKKISSALQSVYKTMSKRNFLNYLYDRGLTWVSMSEFGYFIDNFEFCTFNMLFGAITDDGWNPQIPLRQSENSHNLRNLQCYVKKESENKTRFKDLLETLTCEPCQVMVISIKDDKYEEFTKSTWMEYFTEYDVAIDGLEEKTKDSKKTHEYWISSCFYAKVNMIYNKTKREFSKDDTIIYVDVFRNKVVVPGMDYSSNINDRIIESVDNLICNHRTAKSVKTPAEIVYLSSAEKQKLLKLGCNLVNYFEWMVANNKKAIQRIVNMRYLNMKINDQLHSDLHTLKSIMPVLGDSVKCIKAIMKYRDDSTWPCERLAEHLSTMPSLRAILTNNGIKYENCNVDAMLENVEFNTKKYENVIRLKREGLGQSTKDLILKLL